MRYELDSSVYARVTDFLPRTLLYLQLILQIQTHMSSEGYTSGNIFSKPEHILSFVKHALDAGTAAPPQPSHSRSAKKPGLTMDDLRIVDEDEEDDFEDGGDSDDETPGLEGVPPDEEMTATAMNLLLSILEGTLCQPNSLKLSPVSHVHESQSRPFREHFTHLGRHPSPRRRALKTSFGGSPSARPRSTDGVDGQTGVHLNSFTFQATTKIRRFSPKYARDVPKSAEAPAGPHSSRSRARAAPSAPTRGPSPHGIHSPQALCRYPPTCSRHPRYLPAVCSG